MISGFFLPLVDRARAADGQPPFSDQTLVELRRGERELLDDEGLAVAIRSSTEAEFVVDPDARGHGRGTRMLERLLADAAEGLLLWSHGDHPAARSLAASHGLEPIRELLQLRMPVPDPAPTASVPVAAFRPGQDEAAWLALNARAFAAHPEQGSVSLADLRELEAEPWFDRGDFLLAWRDGELVGYCWLKVEGGLGEIYVIGVAPDQQGAGLGRSLMAAGFARLAERGIHTVALYVEADNVPAVGLYRSLGFTDFTRDVQYAHARPRIGSASGTKP